MGWTEVEAWSLLFNDIPLLYWDLSWLGNRLLTKNGGPFILNAKWLFWFWVGLCWHPDYVYFAVLLLFFPKKKYQSTWLGGVLVKTRHLLRRTSCWKSRLTQQKHQDGGLVPAQTLFYSSKSHFSEGSDSLDLVDIQHVAESDRHKL